MRLKLAAKLHSIGEYYFRRKFWDSSIVYWDMLEKQYPDTEWAPRALVGIMRAYEEIGYQDLLAETRQKILDSQRGFFNGTSLCLRVHGQEKSAHELELLPVFAT